MHTPKRFPLKAGFFSLFAFFVAVSTPEFQDQMHGAETSAIPLALKKIEGQGGQNATGEIGAALNWSQGFRMVTSPAGANRATGQYESGILTARLEAPDGRKLFEQKYGHGDLIQNSRQFADDIHLSLTGKPGIATSQIAVSLNRNGRPQVVLCDFDGDNVRQMTRKGTNVAPAISPHGQRLVFVSLQQGHRGLLNLVDLSSGRQRTLISKPADRIQPVFSPDGKLLAVAMSPDEGPPDLFIVKTSGVGNPRQLTDTPVPETFPSWSPDGKQIVFAANPGPNQSALFLIETGPRKSQPQRLNTGLAHSSQPSWSPDGRKIAFAALERGQSSICVYDLQSGRSSRLTGGSHPVWGANSRHLLFTKGNDLAMADTSTGHTRPILRAAGPITGSSWTR